MNGSSNFSSPTSVNLLSSYFRQGVNTITIQDSNSGGLAGVDLAGSLTGTAITPEPASIFLLGTGLIGAAGLARRRFTPLDSESGLSNGIA